LQKHYQISVRNAIAMEIKVVRSDTLFLPVRVKAQRPEHKSSSKMEATLEARRATASGFEPLLAVPNGCRVHLLSHSDTLSAEAIEILLNACSAADAGSNVRDEGT
jgi:hypothetical protein